MSDGLLLLTHGNIGADMLGWAESSLGPMPVPTEVIGVDHDADPDQIFQQAQDAVARLQKGRGVLVLTDLYGATPSNIAHRLASDQVRVVNGLNLSMLLRAHNYADRSLAEWAELAVEGGQRGIFSGPNP